MTAVVIYVIILASGGPARQLIATRIPQHQRVWPSFCWAAKDFVFGIQGSRATYVLASATRTRTAITGHADYGGSSVDETETGRLRVHLSLLDVSITLQYIEHSPCCRTATSADIAHIEHVMIRGVNDIDMVGGIGAPTQLCLASEGNFAPTSVCAGNRGMDSRVMYGRAYILIRVGFQAINPSHPLYIGLLVTHRNTGLRLKELRIDDIASAAFIGAQRPSSDSYLSCSTSFQSCTTTTVTTIG
jgi:hypothetical protein